jgi:MFS family permease
MNLNSNLKLSILVDGFLRILGLASFTLFIAAVYGLSGKTFDIGLISLATFLPSLFVMLYSGKFFSKFDSGKILMSMSILRLLTYLLAAFFYDKIHLLYFAASLHSLIHQISMVAKMDLDSNLVNDKTRVDYLSIKTLIANVVIVVGPPIGGGLVAWLGTSNAFICLSIISTLLIGWSYVLNKLFKVYIKSIIKKSSVIIEPSNNLGFVKTLKVLKKNPKALVTIFTYCLVAIILEIQAPLIFPFVKEVYNKGPDFASYLLGLAGLGGILGALLPKFTPKIINSNSMPYLMIFDGLMFGIFTLVKTPMFAFILFTFLGILGSLTLIIVEAIVQTEVESESRPQVYSIMQFAGGAGGASVGVLAAYLAELFGTQKILTGAAGIEIFCGLMSAILFFILLKKVKLRYE